MKKRVITVVVLLAVFVAALAGFSIILNQGTDDMTADMGSAKLPVISFEEAGYSVNPLAGYTQEMDVSMMRDQILPVSVGTSVTADIQGYAGKISSFTYEILTLDGKDVLKSETISEVSNTVKLELGDTISDGKEKVLRITLETENEEKIYYYMRVIRAAEFNVQQCLEFAEYFHKTAMEEDSIGELEDYYMTDGAPEGNGLQKVTLASDLKNIGWANLKVQTVGDIVWDIKESNETYTSIMLKYRVKAGEEEKAGNLYSVTEFFKVRFLRGKASLESYERTMNEVFEGNEKNFSKDGILLGLTDDDVSYVANEKGDQISFVQEREVWHYDKKESRISLLFSFADAENDDIRNYKDDHAVRILDMDGKGNTVFAVYGYMNRGKHEGQTGAAIYYYDIEGGYVQEKAFISSRNSGAVVQQRLSNLTYYNKNSNTLYAVFEDTLYKVNLKTQKKEVIQEHLKEGQYVFSANGKYAAYQKDGSLKNADSIEVWNLEKEKSFLVEVPQEEMIRPLGFVNEDIVYGVGRESDAGKDAAGEDVSPFYKLEIRNGKNEVVKSYQVDEVYIKDAWIADNMITMERAVKHENGYKNITQDSITNNEGKKEKEIQPEKISAKGKGFQMRLTDENGITDRNPKLLKPKQMLFERAVVIDFEKLESKGKYYVYGLGKLQGVYDKAGVAIGKADTVRGVVVTSDQTKMWERGNRMLSYQIEEMEPLTVNPNESSLSYCLRQMFFYEKQNVNVQAELAEGKSVLDLLGKYSGGEAVDLSRCTLEQLCYLIGKGTPVLAMTGMDRAILLTGYTEDSFTYIDPASGKKATADEADIRKMTAGSQNAFFGYVK